MPRGARISLLKENVLKEETENYVNVEINHTNPKPVATLTLREEDLVEELVRRFRDEKSRATYRRIVGALGEDLTYRLMRLAWEVRDRIAVSPGAYLEYVRDTCNFSLPGHPLCRMTHTLHNFADVFRGHRQKCGAGARDRPRLSHLQGCESCVGLIRIDNNSWTTAPAAWREHDGQLVRC